MPVSEAYLSQVKKLHNALVQMGEEAIKLIGDAVAALVSNDVVLAKEVIDRDDRLDRKEDENEEWTIQMIALNQPVARDLRLLVAFLRVNSSIERAGDLAVNIAQACQRIVGKDPMHPYVDIPRNYELTRAMWEDSIRAFRDLDEELAHKVRGRDDEVDDANKQTIVQLLEIGQKTPEHLFLITNMIGVSKALERIADLSVDICDEVIFARLGELRHAHARGGRK